MSEKIWEPSEKRIESSLLNFFMIESPLDFDSYFDLHRWSIDNMEAFWSSFWNFSGIIYSKKYETVLTNPTMPGASWFSGSELNYAENLLSGNPEQVAIISVGEGRDDLQLTFSELKHMVALAQKGLEDLGVTKDSRIAAFVPNCIETVI